MTTQTSNANFVLIQERIKKLRNQIFERNNAGLPSFCHEGAKAQSFTKNFFTTEASEVRKEEAHRGGFGILKCIGTTSV